MKSNRKKTDAWDAISCSLNAVSRAESTTDKVKKKWFDLKSRVKKRTAKQMKTDTEHCINIYLSWTSKSGPLSYSIYHITDQRQTAAHP